jgi:polyvinyl alcohol dehydrogenase (cytochrome)
VFVGSASGRFHSLDLASGCTRWTFRADAGIRGAAIVGRAGSSGAMSVFVGDGAANIYRLDANTGELKWKVKVDDHRAARISGSVVLYEDRVIVPVSSSEEGNSAAAAYPCCTFRGSVVSLDAETGKVNWKTYTIPTPAAPVGKSSAGATLYAPSGAAVWHAPTIDPTTGSIFIATGDAYTQPAAPTTDSVMALDIKTGAVKWSKQLTENDAWNMSCGSANPANCPEKAGPDSDFGQPPILISLPGGKRALVVAQKSGHAWAVDPDASGKVLWELKLGKGGVIGGFEWGSGSDGANFYAPLSDLSFNVPQMWGRGGLDPSKGGGLYAIRIADGQLAWTAPPPACPAPPCSPAQPAPPAIVPGAVFAGSLDGTLRAYSSSDGKVIWSFDTAKTFETVNGVTASGGAIDVGGPAIARGYVLTTSGYSLWGGKRGNVLLAFGPE